MLSEKKILENGPRSDQKCFNVTDLQNFYCFFSIICKVCLFSVYRTRIYFVSLSFYTSRSKAFKPIPISLDIEKR